MGMLIACSKGCGEAIEVTTEMIEEATAAGSALNVCHEVCPNEPTAKQRKFKITVEVLELHEELVDDDGEGNTVTKVDPELLASVGSTLEAGSFKQALPGLQEELNNQWSRVIQLADIVDASQAQEAPSDPQ